MRVSRVLFACALLVTVAAFAAPAPADGQPLTNAHESLTAPGAIDHPCGVVADGQYVRLRGSPVIHLRSCELVKRADPDGIVPAGKDEGPPCIHCRRSEVR
jgi:hypothetical protein